jgi:hypothetical protein
MEVHTDPGPLIQVSDLFSFLYGRWSVHRKISDHRLNTSGSFNGQATYSGDKETLQYLEEGQLRFADYSDTAFRRYDFVFPNRATANVFFGDGRAFHNLDLTTGQWTAHHECGEDIYRGLFRATSQSSYEAEWGIKGPNKDLVLFTNYRRSDT